MALRGKPRAAAIRVGLGCPIVCNGTDVVKKAPSAVIPQDNGPIPSSNFIGDE